MGYERWIGGRYVRARSGNRFVSLISAISILGIAIAVAVLIVVLSVVNGFERELRERLLAMSGHAVIEGPDAPLSNWEPLGDFARSDDRVVATAPYVSGQGLLVLGEKLSGAELRGIDPAQENTVSGIDELLTAGAIADLQPRAFNIVLGSELASAIGADVGDKVTVTLAEGVVTPAGLLPRQRRFTVSGIYHVGMYEFDRRLAFIHLRDAQRLFRTGDAVTGIRLSVTEIYTAFSVVRDVAVAAGGGVVVSDWTRRHINFFRSIQITKSILFVIMLLLVAVAAFNIVSTLVMVVKDKQADIAILRTLGASPRSVLKIFVTQGTIIGVLGTLLGLVAGVLFTANLETIVGFVEGLLGTKLLAADVYFISDLPAELRVADVATVCSIALLLALVATFYPAWRGARTLPAEALRYD